MQKSVRIIKVIFCNFPFPSVNSKGGVGVYLVSPSAKLDHLMISQGATVRMCFKNMASPAVHVHLCKGLRTVLV